MHLVLKNNQGKKSQKKPSEWRNRTVRENRLV